MARVPGESDGAAVTKRADTRPRHIAQSKPCARAEELARGMFSWLSKDRYLTEFEHNRIVTTLLRYGAEVRKRDAEICRDEADKLTPSTKVCLALYDLAAAIKTEKMP